MSNRLIPAHRSAPTRRPLARPRTSALLGSTEPSPPQRGGFRAQLHMARWVAMSFIVSSFAASTACAPPPLPTEEDWTVDEENGAPNQDANFGQGGFLPADSSADVPTSEDVNASEPDTPCSSEEENDTAATETGSSASPSSTTAPPTTDHSTVDTCAGETPVIRFSEVFFDPEGRDTSEQEFVELLSAEVDLVEHLSLVLFDPASGEITHNHPFTLQHPQTSSANVDLADPSQAPSRWIFGGSSDNPLPFTLPNQRGGLALVWCDTEVIERVTWGEPGLISGIRSQHASTSGESLSRCTSDSALVPTAPSPAAPNAPARNGTWCPSSCASTDSSSLRLVEVSFNPDGADSGNEYIRFTGTMEHADPGLRLIGINGSSGLPYFDVPLPFQRLSGGASYMLGGEEITPRNGTLEVGLQNGPDALFIVGCDGNVLDQVYYGDFPLESLPLDSAGGCEELGEGAICWSEAEERWRACPPNLP